MSKNIFFTLFKSKFLEKVRVYTYYVTSIVKPLEGSILKSEQGAAAVLTHRKKNSEQIKPKLINAPKTKTAINTLNLMFE